MDIFEQRLTLFVDILLPLNVKGCFTYRVPFELNEEIVVGKRVSVPFGRHKIVAGLIYAINETPPERYEAKYLYEVLDDIPVVTEKQFEFWSWMANYYMCNLGLVMNAALPAGLKMEGESKLIQHPHPPSEMPVIDSNEQIILDYLQNAKEVSITQARSILKLNGIHKYVQSLYLKGLILLKDDIEGGFKPKTTKYISIHPEFQKDDALNAIFTKLEKRAPKQVDCLLFFISQVGIENRIEKAKLKSEKATASAIAALVTKGILVEEEIETSRLQLHETEEKEITLNAQQNVAYESILEGFEKDAPVLLHGVTGSGKTHIYQKLIAEELGNGNQVAYLLPEIALTSQLIERLAAYFGDKMVVTHSKFSSNERVEVYHKVMTGEPLLIVGTRSAIFQPFTNCGLFIIDEEHEQSFKQHDPAPRFNARDCAIYLKHKLQSKVVLGTATPAIESYYNSETNKYHRVELSARFDSIEMPEILLVDMQKQKKQKRNKGIFSDTLLDAISQNKEIGKQTILFQNKKGYVPMLECDLCAWTPKCINCDISLTYYKYQDNLRCHYCGYTQPTIVSCKNCGNNGIQLVGHGTERIEDELKLYIPDIRIQRMDYNTTRLKNSHKKIIDAFSNGEIDVLIGTQMVAKGLDFDNVTIVGVMNADHLLNFPDFRANERAFQMLTQVSGRAGRKQERGAVYIQTSNVNHPGLQWIVTGDYKSMYEMEMAERHDFLYPPYSRLVKIVLKHKDALELYKVAQHTKGFLHAIFGDQLLGPEKPYVGKIRNLYLVNFLLKIENNAKNIAQQKGRLKLTIAQLQQDKQYKNVRIVLDVDPI